MFWVQMAIERTGQVQVIVTDEGDVRVTGDGDMKNMARVCLHAMYEIGAP